MHVKPYLICTVYNPTDAWWSRGVADSGSLYTYVVTSFFKLRLPVVRITAILQRASHGHTNEQ